MITNWDPERNFFAFGWLAYDFTNGQEMFTAIENDGREMLNVTYIFLYSKGMAYRVIEEIRTGRQRCESFQVPTQMPQYCVPMQTFYRGNFTLGGSLVVKVFEWMGGESKGHIQVTSDGCIPVKADVLTPRNSNADVEEYFNYIPSVDPGVFMPPSICS